MTPQCSWVLKKKVEACRFGDPGTCLSAIGGHGLDEIQDADLFQAPFFRRLPPNLSAGEGGDSRSKANATLLLAYYSDY